MLIIGHGGAAGLAPENTISSFKLGQESGAQILEADLRRTKDGKIVLCHDSTLKRTHGIDKKISQMTLAEIKDATGKLGKEVPELSEFIGMAKLPVNLDVKESGFEKEIIESIKGFAYKVLITSWNPLVIKKIKALDENIDVGPIVGSGYRFLLPLVTTMLRNTNVYSITVGPKLVSSRRMKNFKKLGWKVFPFTINDKQEFDRLKNLEVDGVFTDYPNKFIN